jgi:prepilin-type N-terminal cleavage/methylation domain-containing protein
MKALVSINKTSSARHSAFTLVEVTMAVAVMAIVFVSIFSAMTMSLFVSETSRENLRATQIMMDKMEGLRLYSPSQLTNTAFLMRSFTNWYCETNNIGEPNVQGYGVQYTGSLIITNVPYTTSYSSNMYQVTVTVNWTSIGQGNIAHTRSATAYYANQGLYNYVY